jgi:ABC-type sugar transport system substrate-binding protein
MSKDRMKPDKTETQSLDGESSVVGREVDAPAKSFGSKPFTRTQFLRGAGGLGGLALAGGFLSAGAHAAAASSPAAGGLDRIVSTAVSSKYQHKKIGVVTYFSGDQNITWMAGAVKEAAKKAGLNWTFDTVDGQQSTTTQQAAISGFTTEGVDAILLISVGGTTLAAQMSEAKAKKIPMFGLWTPNDLDPNLVLDYRTAWMTDAAALGGYMFRDLDTRYPKGYDVALLNTSLPALADRYATVQALAPLFPLANIVTNADIDLTNIVGSSTTITNGWVAKYPNLKAIWTSYPTSGPAAANALLANNKGDVRVYSHNAEQPGIEAIVSSSNPLVAMPWADWDWQGYYMVNYMLQYFSGKVPSRLVTYENLVPQYLFTHETGKPLLKGAGTAAGIGWTTGDGKWKSGLVNSWKRTYAS